VECWAIVDLNNATCLGLKKNEARYLLQCPICVGEKLGWVKYGVERDKTANTNQNVENTLRGFRGGIQKEEFQEGLLFPIKKATNPKDSIGLGRCLQV